MLATINVGPYSGAIPIALSNRGTSTSAGSFSAVQIGTSLIRRTVDLGSLADGEYDAETTYPPGVWALKVESGVATFYDDWADVPTGNDGTGEYTVNFLVRDSLSLTPLLGALVTLQSSGQPTRWGFTDATGHISFSVGPGSYTYNASASGHASVTAVALTVSGNSSPTVSLVDSTTTPPPVSGLCAVTFSVLKQNGDALEGALVQVELEGTTNSVDSHLISRALHSGVTNASGIVTLTMVQFAAFTQGGIYVVEVFDVTGKRIYERRVKVPTASTANGEDLIGV